MRDLSSWEVVVLYGGIGPERAVSIESGKAVEVSLKKHPRLKVRACCLDTPELPDGLGSSHQIVFPMLHGAFGEDGTLQNLLSERGISFVGSGAEASALCMHKFRTIERVKGLGIACADSIAFSGDSVPLADAVIEQLGESLVLKPSDSGSSHGLKMIDNRSSLGVALSQIDSGNWMIEQRLWGRELSIGLLGNEPLEIVEIQTDRAAFDYYAKYESSKTQRICPADLPSAIALTIAEQAQAIFVACGCSDCARIDFILVEDQPYFLEVNTIPGMSEHSLLPLSARARGIDFDALILKMLTLAMDRSEALNPID